MLFDDALYYLLNCFAVFLGKYPNVSLDSGIVWDNVECLACFDHGETESDCGVVLLVGAESLFDPDQYFGGCWDRRVTILRLGAVTASSFDLTRWLVNYRNIEVKGGGWVLTVI